MVDKVSVVRYTYSNEKFELLVKPDPAFDYKLGKITEISKILVSDEIYTDSSKGTRPSSEKLVNVFKTDDPTKIAEIIMQKGELNLTTEQRKKMTAEKKKQIITFIAKTYVDPKTHLPHPPLRIEQAMVDGRISIDPFKKTDDQMSENCRKTTIHHPSKIRKSYFRNFGSSTICCTILYCFKINGDTKERRLATKWFIKSNTRNTSSRKTKRD